MFRFRFESLLKHRRHEEEVAQKMLAEARVDLRREQSLLKRIKKSRRDQIRQLQHLQTGTLAPQEITLSLQYVDRLRKRIDQQQEKVQQARQRADRRQQALVGAVKKRKMLEKLKETELRRFRRDQNKKELKFMDEVAVNRHIRGDP